VVSYRVRLAAPPWPAPISLGVVVGIPASAADSSQITYYHLGPAQFAVRGPSGVQIHLRAGVGARRQHNALYPVVVVGHTVEIAGTTNPELAGAHLQVGYRSTTSARRGAIGAVTTNKRGAFHIAWTPSVKGTYTVTSSYRNPAAGLLADHNCDLALTAT
jgi:hypothetical protein